MIRLRPDDPGEDLAGVQADADAEVGDVRLLPNHLHRELHVQGEVRDGHGVKRVVVLDARSSHYGRGREEVGKDRKTTEEVREVGSKSGREMGREPDSDPGATDSRARGHS